MSGAAQDTHAVASSETPLLEVLARGDVASVYLGTARATAGTAASTTRESPGADIDGHRFDQLICVPTPSKSGGTALLRLENVSAGYGLARVLHSLDLAVRPGETVVILGTNGAG